jgi:hypothetical protein
MATTTIETGTRYSAKRVLGQVIPYIVLILSISPIVLGYAWLIIATFSYRTEGLFPIDAEGW